jgi:UDP-N-acetyl-D-glucosamine/UDP-N-acetyl-D-galactosamine dehydrogenase
MNPIVAVVGLGYVGLPLVVEFGKRFRTIGFDIDIRKVDFCKDFMDPSREISSDEMRLATRAVYSADPAALREADFVIVAGANPCGLSAYTGFWASDQGKPNYW